MKTFDAIVVGCGGFGSAAMSHLAGRGLKVLGIDQFAPPHDRGSSHGETRVIRKAYFEHPDYVPLLHRAYQLWDQLQECTAELRPVPERELFVRSGLLLAGPADGEVISGVRSAAQEHSLQIETPDRGQLAERYPGIRVPDGLEVVYEADAGYLWAERCVKAHLQHAVRQGATVTLDDAVTQLKFLPGHVEVQTTRQCFSAAAVVVAAGAWTRQLMPDYTARIRIRRKTLFWYSVTSDAQGRHNDSPIHLMELADGRQFYGFPSVDGQSVKLAEHTGGVLVQDPSEIRRTVDPGESEAVDRYAADCLVGVHATPHRSAVCMYSMSPDGHFLLDRLPDIPVVVAAGFSGHGFKFTSVLGEAIADLVQNGQTDLPVDFLSARRLQSVDLFPADLT